MEFKVIETKYKGRYFRSRLEARWAVFFDTLGLEWDYEPEGFDLGELKYLPDFWIPALASWVEIKGKRPEGKDFEKCRAFMRSRPDGPTGSKRFDITGYSILIGSPTLEEGNQGYRVFSPGHERMAPSECYERKFAFCPKCKQFDLFNIHTVQHETIPFPLYYTWCLECEFGDSRNLPDKAEEYSFYKHWVITKEHPAYSLRIQNAYNAALSARF